MAFLLYVSKALDKRPYNYMKITFTNVKFMYYSPLCSLLLNVLGIKYYIIKIPNNLYHFFVVLCYREGLFGSSGYSGTPYVACTSSKVMVLPLP